MVKGICDFFVSILCVISVISWLVKYVISWLVKYTVLPAPITSQIHNFAYLRILSSKDQIHNSTYKKGVIAISLLLQT